MENENVSRIQRVSAKFRLLFAVLIACIPVFSMLYWLFFNYLPDELTTELPVSVNQMLPFSTRVLAFVVSLIPAGVAIYGLFTLKKLFRLYEHGIIFSTKNVICFHHLGYTLISWVFANMIFYILISAVLTFHRPPGERLIVVQFGISDTATLLIGAIIVLVSWVMHEATKLEDEQAFTV